MPTWQQNITALMRQHEISGTVRVTQSEQPLLETAHGYANRTYNIPNQHSTRFGIASGCKLFTAVAILRLVENNQLALEDEVSSFLVLDGIDLEGVTIHHLLTHTSGIVDYFDEETMDDFEELFTTFPMYRLRTPRDFLQLIGNRPRVNEAGVRFQYNNLGYVLLGMLIETISGQSFPEFIQHHIFDRAQMKQSGYFSFDALPEDTAIGYIDQTNGSWRTNQYALPVIGGPDGGAFVTADDLERFWQALTSHALLSRSFTELLFQPHVIERETSGYGYGVWLELTGAGVIWKYHIMGYDPGVSCHSAYYPHDATIVSVLCNQSKGAYTISKAVEETLFKCAKEERS